MKNLAFAALLLSASLVTTASGQVKSVVAANKPTATTNEKQATANASRVRSLSQDPKSVPTGSIISSGRVSNNTTPGFTNHSQPGRFRRANNPAEITLDSRRPAAPNATVDAVKSAAVKSNTNALASPTQFYRVGIRDVLDIQLADNPGRNSTLFTVQEGGVLEYPLAGNPIVVAGLTPPEIAALLRQRIKIFDNPNVAVTVRDYASHAVTISGLVAAPGTKVLRREAVPLYTVLAEASILPEAARATITRQGQAPIVVDLKDANLSATPVVSGDVIRVSGQPAGPTEFYFVGGEISSPGQKAFHAGLTLTQAILASGGVSSSAGVKVKVSRSGADGRLVTDEYNLRKIQAGKTPDPVLQKGDRIEVTNSN